MLTAIFNIVLSLVGIGLCLAIIVATIAMLGIMLIPIAGLVLVAVVVGTIFFA